MPQAAAKTAIPVESLGFVVAGQDVSDIELDSLLTEGRLTVLARPVVVA